ncbi:MAG: hypothetical protein A2622_09395 [Bdellovibrionales bacterium RIFCSPHIGHO2_01_FULL_40_29]|nr:MAG: hypothetical protein A2622_09395 [Bdellovibrionales bacterium RIFCSPHIGHO2_01_FULL_40_29]OFZ33561.1 MAG: hypothetical protein A3D17_00225 [Bdellovibrionales bacterium RIFCSPHIGHO2_02_FULL_40_15]
MNLFLVSTVVLFLSSFQADASGMTTVKFEGIGHLGQACQVAFQMDQLGILVDFQLTGTVLHSRHYRKNNRTEYEQIFVTEKESSFKQLMTLANDNYKPYLLKTSSEDPNEEVYTFYRHVRPLVKNGPSQKLNFNMNILYHDKNIQEVFMDLNSYGYTENESDQLRFHCYLHKGP